MYQFGVTRYRTGRIVIQMRSLLQQGEKILTTTYQKFNSIQQRALNKHLMNPIWSFGSKNRPIKVAKFYNALTSALCDCLPNFSLERVFTTPSFKWIDLYRCLRGGLTKKTEIVYIFLNYIVNRQVFVCMPFSMRHKSVITIELNCELEDKAVLAFSVWGFYTVTGGFELERIIGKEEKGERSFNNF